MYLRECFSLDTATGVLYWRTRPMMHFGSATAALSWNTRFAGSEVGFKRADGRIGVKVSYAGVKSAVLAHRIVWALVHGEDAAFEIDHINGMPSDNRPGNLRLATRYQNTQNRPGARGRTLPKGVYPHGAGYRVIVTAFGNRCDLGVYGTVETARAAWESAARAAHGDFFREVAA
jgi:hypothetical protein